MNYRVYVKKKEAFRVEADSLFHELKQNLNLSDVHGIELYNVYDVFNGDDHDMELLKDKVLSEKVTERHTLLMNVCLDNMISGLIAHSSV